MSIYNDRGIYLGIINLQIIVMMYLTGKFMKSPLQMIHCIQFLNVENCWKNSLNTTSLDYMIVLMLFSSKTSILRR